MFARAAARVPPRARAALVATNTRLASTHYRRPSLASGPEPPNPEHTKEWADAVVREQGHVAFGMTPLESDLLPITVVQRPPIESIPRLHHGLDRVLVKRGVHRLSEFTDSSLGTIVSQLTSQTFPVSSFVTSSDDPTLAGLARAHGARFAGSTSSMSALLANMYFALAHFRKTNTSMLSSTALRMQHGRFTWAATKPVAIVLRPRDGFVAVDSASADSADKPLVLMDFGKQIEHVLTSPADELLEAMRPGGRAQASRTDTYRYSLMGGDMLLRSQLDCFGYFGPSGAGRGTVFDLKTRAVLPIRLDWAHYIEHGGYRLNHVRGALESYEREFADMTRSTMIKYIVQARIGGMGGIVVAYHNIRELFGFECIPLGEMERAVYGRPRMGRALFDLELRLARALLGRIVDDVGAEPAHRVLVHTRPGGVVSVFVQRVVNDSGWTGDDAAPLAVAPEVVAAYTMRVASCSPSGHWGAPDDGVVPRVFYRIERLAGSQPVLADALAAVQRAFVRTDRQAERVRQEAVRVTSNATGRRGSAPRT